MKTTDLTANVRKRKLPEVEMQQTTNSDQRKSETEPEDLNNDDKDDPALSLSANVNSALEQPSSDSNIDLDDFKLKKSIKKRKKGIIYVSNIPKHMNVTRIREILGEFGKIGRVYLQPEKQPKSKDDKKKKRRHKHRALHFTEGWVEFESKRVAKQIVPLLNNKQISTRKKSQFFDYLWSMKYLPRFKWTHLTERMNYELAVQKQRLMTEVSQARKEKSFFQNNLDKSEFLKKNEKKLKKIEAKAAKAAALETPN